MVMTMVAVVMMEKELYSLYPVTERDLDCILILGVCLGV